ncbi:rho guanine nucleotide exchange factor 17 isoform X2 [Lycorma delicatula]|uniref:rho guanine nucleotide exchange factor 17 isoform X2 n=1 Tax=Lycorma delicatula TaxID=130591 RepID=UPI003F51A859
MRKSLLLPAGTTTDSAPISPASGTPAAPPSPRAAVTIGEVRVRLSLAPNRRQEVARPGVQPADCCCGVAWPSRIPLSNNSNSGSPVYRSSLEWTRVAASCFGRGGSSGDTQRLIAEDTLDRLPRFRFGGGQAPRVPKRSNKKKPPRNSDKAERLRELTEKLKTPPPSNARAEPGPSRAPRPLPADVPAPTTTTPAIFSSATATDSDVERREPPPQEDVFECVDLKLPKPKSRTIVGSYIQRTIPFRSASFSRVDFSPVDGKYIRNNGRSLSSGSHTLPKKKTNESSSPSVSPSGSSTAAVEGRLASNPSIDSAVGSEEWIFPAVVLPSPARSAESTHKQLSSRSLTHPLPTRGTATEEEIPYRSIDGNGMKSLVAPTAERQLEGLREESDTDSAAAPSECDVEKCNTLRCTSDARCDTDSVREEVTVVSNVKDDDRSSTNADANESVNVAEDNKRVTSEAETFVAEWPVNKYAEETSVDPSDDVKIIRTEFNRLKEVELPGRETTNKSVDVKPGPSEEWTASSAQEEPQSPEETGGRPAWPSGKWLERPGLVCQSSEERDEGSPRRRSFVLLRADSLSEGESDPGRPGTPCRDTASPSPSLFPPSDQSDCEGRPHTPRRYSKRPLRGPYGQMLEAEMKKPETSRKFSKLQKEELKFLEEYVQPPPVRPIRAQDDCQLKRSYTSPDPPPGQTRRTSPKRKVSANIPYSAPNPTTAATAVANNETVPAVCHQRTTSSPSQLEGCSAKTSARPSPQLLAQLLKGSSERIYTTEHPNVNFNHPTILPQHWKDTRTHVVVELYDTERSYVESLQILVTKYLHPLKSPENAGLVDASLVDEIFYQVPAILMHHEVFLEELRRRLEHWDVKQRVGDIFLDTFTKQSVIDTYTAFINNWKTAKEAIKATCQAKPAFARFLDAMAREHKGKLALDSLLIMPVQRIPRYELLIQTLLKHTEPNHPDHGPLLDAQREVHALAVRINCTERESLELEQLESLIEGVGHLNSPDRTFIRHDLVTMVTSQGRKERALFLFSDLLLITSIKRRSGTIRKPSTPSPGSVASTLEANKYKVLLKISLHDFEIVKTKDENVRRLLREMEHLLEDVQTVNQIMDLLATLHCSHSQVEDAVRELSSTLSKQLAERQSADSQLSYLELIVQTDTGVENISLIFSKPDKRSCWEEAVNEAKQRLALSVDRRPSPEFLAPVPIRKTRAGLQFTCAAPTLLSVTGPGGTSCRDVWVCNSDGYVGQVCVLSLDPEPTVTSCNGVCNARILCIAAVPGYSVNSSSSDGEVEPDEEGDETNRGVSCTSEVDVDSEDAEPTMWLGTEDGCIHVYNCTDNIRIKKNKVKIQHGSPVHSIIYLDNRVFVSLANGDITVYSRDLSGGWNTADPQMVTVGTVSTPVTRMLPINDKLWCSCHSTVKVLNTANLNIENSFSACSNCGGVGGEGVRSISCLAAAGLGVWISLQNSATLRLFHANTYDCLAEVNVASAVTKMLTSCDDIIRQHKAACLRITSLLACKDLLWIGTSAGVILTMPLPHVPTAASKITSPLNVTGVPHGHTGHVRFLTAVESPDCADSSSSSLSGQVNNDGNNNNNRLLVISGGDGYEDFRSASMSEVAGREDSTNHLLLWSV